MKWSKNGSIQMGCMLALSGASLLHLLQFSGCPFTEDDDDSTETPDTETPAETPSDETPTEEPTQTPDPTAECQEDSFKSCTAKTGTNGYVLLKGTITTDEATICSGDILFSPVSGLIECVGEDCSGSTHAQDATVVCTEGIIVPGFINPHDHMQYNTLPQWQHTKLYQNRYEWQADGDYHDFMEGYDAVDGESCMVSKYAEARALISGVTSALGTSSNKGDSCLAPMIRDLDADPVASGITGLNIYYTAGKIANVSDSSAATIIANLNSGTYSAYVPHISEGINGTVRYEFNTLQSKGLLRSDVAIVHGTDFTANEFTQQSIAGTGLIFSPQSNIDLYGKMTQIPLAKNLGVKMAMSTDWTPSGTMNTLTELQCLSHVNENFYNNTFTEKEIFAMSNANAADVLQVGDQIGRLQAGFKADITVLSGDRTHPTSSILNNDVKNVQLVFVDGQALYGDTTRMVDEKLAATPYCETIDVCGTSKLICVQSSATDEAQPASDTLATMESTLQALLDAAAGTSEGYQFDLYDLFQCDTLTVMRHDCNPVGGLSSDDDDHDGVLNSADKCPLVYDPYQIDTDKDGTGDMCDTCPLTPAQTCSLPLSATDPDEDGKEGTSDNCPFVYNESQSDSDTDGIGDVCDVCPTYSNPSGKACGYTIPDIRNPQSTNKPTIGSAVTVLNAIVTTVKADGTTSQGYFLQDITNSSYAGIFVFTGSTAPTVTAGQLIELSGTYTEYNGLSEITSSTSTVIKGTGTIPSYISISDPSTIATGGVDQEKYESMLVTVSNVEVINANPDSPNDYDEFTVGKKGATLGVRVDDFIYTALDQPALGTSYSTIKAPLYVSFGNSKLTPATAGDLVLATAKTSKSMKR